MILLLKTANGHQEIQDLNNRYIQDNSSLNCLTLAESFRRLAALANLGFGNPIEAICDTISNSLGPKLPVGSGSLYVSVLTTGVACGLGGGCEDTAASYDGSTGAFVVVAAGTLE